ncbi:pilus assembly chaperone [Trabulsiella guamensis ATCC 49490]|uniref:Pilus assembly chaperone n=1 Tax=Trabulsiella guamensis ATCC 49490 TaxID=1005994 RepID=A0A085A816_9ENTR|nr:molecular chaperone [Trabulsiella guamensis]KFC06361.1 pilus assembly chaperone [Trabulsiella guamensis ATCC 49490]
MRNWHILFLSLLFLGNGSNAGITIESSRVVFSASDRERSLMLANSNDYPVLIQTWVDNGALKNMPENVDNVPVIPLPSVFRLEPKEKKNLRLLATHVPQATDRESLYWLNVYEISPTETKFSVDLSTVKVAVRLQLKLFFRPENLTPVPDKIAEKQHIELLRSPGKTSIKVSNPTPYFVTYNSLILASENGEHILSPGMLSPFSSKTIDTGVSAHWQPLRIILELIDDNGKVVNENRRI